KVSAVLQEIRSSGIIDAVSAADDGAKSRNCVAKPKRGTKVFPVVVMNELVGLRRILAHELCAGQRRIGTAAVASARSPHDAEVFPGTAEERCLSATIRGNETASKS